jgi:hypothetical protein
VLRFERVESPVPEIKAWGARDGQSTYVVTFDGKFDRYYASVKRTNTGWVATSTIKLGEYMRKSEALHACEQYRRNQA